MKQHNLNDFILHYLKKQVGEKWRITRFPSVSRYGFRTPPDLEIALKPCFGGKTWGKYENTVSSVFRQLENRLKQEFMKVLVYPNLDDEVLPFLDHVDYSLNK